jgi:hypothetical protein
VNRADYQSHSPRLASRRVQRCIALLKCASTELYRASGAANDTHSRNRLKCLASSLRNLAVPMSRIASHLERGECL